MIRLSDGAEVQLTDDTSDEGGFRWSPDGSQLVFSSSRTNDADLYLMNPARAEVRRLTQHKGTADWHQWSPDGTRIAYAVTAADDHAWIYLVEAESGRTTVVVDHPSRNVAPAWSPDGQQLVFASDRDGDFELYVVNVSELTD